MKTVPAGASKYAAELERQLGRRLLVLDEVAGEPGYLSVATRTLPEEGHGLVECELRLEILQAPDETDVPRVWALVFAFINGVRSNGAAGDYLILERDTDGKWSLAGWERDDSGEWADAELPDLEQVPSD